MSREERIKKDVGEAELRISSEDRSQQIWYMSGSLMVSWIHIGGIEVYIKKKKKRKKKSIHNPVGVTRCLRRDENKVVL